MNTCNHPHNQVVADIFEGDAMPYSLAWCRRCGAYKKSFNANSPKSYTTAWASPERTFQGVTCPKCGNYYGGHATGGLDICDCHMKP